MNRIKSLATFRWLFLFLFLGSFFLLIFSSAPSEIGSDKVAGSLVSTGSKTTYASKPVFQKGMSYVAWSSSAYNSSDSDASLNRLAETNTEWVAICVFWYQSNISSYDIHADPERTPNNESVAHVISQAHGLGLKVMLKPMVDPLETEGIYLRPAWRGEIPPSDEWFESYSNFINFFADFAEHHEVELFCIGCELKETTQDAEHWENIISGVRERYSGPITYAADFSNYHNIEWWSFLDYVGIDAYFPLTLLKYEPTLEELRNAWAIHVYEIESWWRTIDKPIIFTEIGYRSGNRTNMMPGNYWTEMSVDLQEQVDCYEAAFQALWSKSWFYGFYWWNWETDPNAGGLNDAGYTPQNKPVQDTITNWYSLSRFFTVVDQTFVSVNRCSVGKSQSVGFHVSWEHNSTDVAGASVYVNGTEYITNETGWINFDTSYNTVGKRVWAVTAVHSGDAICYKKTVSNPYIIWDQIEITKIDTDTTSLGILKVKATVTYVYDETPVMGATITANGLPCVEIELGIYACELSTWHPHPTVKIETNFPNFAQTTKTISTFHVMNLGLYLAFFTLATSMTFLIVRYYRKHLKRRARIKSFHLPTDKDHKSRLA